MSIINIPEKLDASCSLVYLIDENFCAKDSLDIINYNVQSLCANLAELEARAQKWNDVYTNFIANSAAWLASSSDIQYYNAKWMQAYSTVTSLSATWNQEFSIYYPEILPITDWYGSDTNTPQQNSYKQTNFPKWLNKTFPSTNYTNKQVINLFVNLNQSKSFDYTFSKVYYEPCIPSGFAEVVCTNPSTKPSRGCNHHGGRNGNKPCDNAYNYCTMETPRLGYKITCNGYATNDKQEILNPNIRDIANYRGKNLKVGKYISSSDSSVARIISIKYINNTTSNTWEFYK